ncbi:alcohol oxidase [Cantharellus anzutake]|uniref:alcohol oxidase n=1 Tax=Cantharellus anzutake TaxID=1750568 RepID=UPI001902E035|nr:alcohol oxidase [Cantharellus anzutake]KAF8329341.1 alcohol oxidase [Cantharellus anzutake]
MAWLKFIFAALTLISRACAGIIYNGQIDDAYDFVICGGGLAGLVIASRLTEDSNHTVLVLEAGDSGDAVKQSIDVPSNAYFSTLLGTSYDWQFVTTPQPGLGGKTAPWPRGKVVGGSSAVNGMYLVRPSTLEMNAWRNLLGDMPNADAWGWDRMFAYMKKSETFTPPTKAVQDAGAIQFDPASHGSSGPLHYSYPGFIFPIVGNWTSTLDWIGIPPSPDSNGGSGWGAFIATSAINPSNWTRSYSRSAYIDPLPPRPNLAILPNATVTRIIFSGSITSAIDGSTGLNASAVEFASNPGATRRTVLVRKEVIVTGGAIGSPNILMHSGVGPKDILNKAGVPIKHTLPGVGQHLQDHISTQVVFQLTPEAAASLHQDTHTPGITTSRLASFVNSAIAYANVSDLVGPDYAPTFKKDIQSYFPGAYAKVPSSDPTVKAGFAALYNTTLNNILLTRAGQVELLFSLMDSVSGGTHVAIQAALQHPYSAGSLYIQNNDPFAAPIIDPQYLSNEAGKWYIVMLREGLKLARTLGVTQPLNLSIATELIPGPKVNTDPAWDAWLATQVGTEFHPSGTCALLPLSLGGVVDANLKVYGLANVRVADSSVFALEFAAHLMAPTYGLAEQASDLIRETYWVNKPTSTTSSGAQSRTGSPSSTAPPSSTSRKSASSQLEAPSLFGGALALLASLFVF